MTTRTRSPTGRGVARGPFQRPAPRRLGGGAARGPWSPGRGTRRTSSSASRLEHPGAVVVLAVDDDERVMCLRQYRHTSRHEFVELPAGLRDAGDEPAGRDREARAARGGRAGGDVVAAAAQHLRQRGDHRRGARDLPGPRADPRAAGRLRDARTRRPRWRSSGCRWPTCSTPSSTGRVRQGPLAQAVLAVRRAEAPRRPRRRRRQAAPGVRLGLAVTRGPRPW